MSTPAPATTIPGPNAAVRLLVSGPGEAPDRGTVGAIHCTFRQAPGAALQYGIRFGAVDAAAAPDVRYYAREEFELAYA